VGVGFNICEILILCFCNLKAKKQQQQQQQTAQTSKEVYKQFHFLLVKYHCE